MLSKKEIEMLDDAFLDSMEKSEDGSIESARALLDAWNLLWDTMVRENNFSDKLGSKEIDWQIGNWANDTSMALHNAHLYEEEIRVNEQILKITWSHGENTFHENAKRDIADAYADMGNVNECIRLYEQYLDEDPLWGWGWIGYFRQLRDHNDERFESVLHSLYEKVIKPEDFRDNEDLILELIEEFQKLVLKAKDEQIKALREELASVKRLNNLLRMSPNTAIIKERKTYPNDPCPCGSGKKYKKCCGKK